MMLLEKISKSFDQNHIFSDFSLSINDNDHVAIIGSSGKGKTTLLRIIAFLETIDGGTLNGWTPNDISFSFQESRLFPHLTVLDNVACGSDLPIKQARKKAADLLKLVKLSDSAHLYPAELSGGMSQRVSLARAMIRNRRILLLDEPFSALDQDTKNEMIQIIQNYTKDKTLILVSHDMNDVEKLTSIQIDLNEI